MKLSKEVKIGLLATSALAIVYVGFNFLKGKEVFSSNNIYYTTYDQCKGLGLSSPVVLNGIPVGRVRDIQILPNKKHSVLVTFETKKEIKLTDATKARLISPSFLGDKAIDLLIEEGNLLKNRDSVPGEVEQGWEDMFTDHTLPAMQDIKNISVLTSQFVLNLIKNIDKINDIFDNLEATTRHLKKTIARRQTEFYALSSNLSAVSSALADRKDGIEPILIKLNQLLQAVKAEEAKEISEKLNRILDGIIETLDATGQGKNSLGKMLCDSSLYDDLNQPLGSLDKLLIDLKRNPRRYVSFSIFGSEKCLKRKHKE